ncbi:hypothetical protein PGT21_013361 [Puccinia graminis f. sp. tritici]|uniref:Uncharacterized protein n=1 Tax=Puccinia graminis f. sp. tritici TaxID=56615 RepID=A0A5B0QWK6_PUCGR|nr:hypothetical protein PGT21_013361 [Puccinia graminis f. sp. tritici]
MSNSRAFALDESSAINFKPYDSSNHKAQLVDFIRLVDNHAIIPPKIKVNPLRDLANKYLNILIGRSPGGQDCSKSRHPSLLLRGVDQQPADGCSITSNELILGCCSITSRTQSYSQAISGKISISGRASVGSITSQTPSKIVQAQCCRASVSPSPKQIYYSPPITRKILLVAITSQTISTIRSTRGQSPARPRPSKPSNRKKNHISPKTKKISFPVPKTCPFSKSITSTQNSEFNHR